MSTISYSCGWKLTLALKWVFTWGYQLGYLQMASMCLECLIIWYLDTEIKCPRSERSNREGVESISHALKGQA